MALHLVDNTAPPLGRREQQRRETRNRLFEAALAEIRRVGFSRMQIDRVVEKVGVARGTFYFHFPSKEHVLLEVQRRQEASIVERFGAAFRERPGSVRDFLLSVVEAMISQAQTIGEPELGREVLAMYVRQPRVVDVSSYPLVVAIVDYFAEAAERGEVRSDIPPEEITRIILTSLFGSIITAADDFEERLQGFRSWIDVFVRGISP